MACGVNAFHSVVLRERPDFALQFRGGDLPFGVEITQLFPDESHVRLNLPLRVSTRSRRTWTTSASGYSPTLSFVPTWVTHNRLLVEAGLRPWTPAFSHGALAGDPGVRRG